jgi:hypothetical protein
MVNGALGTDLLDGKQVRRFSARKGRATLLHLRKGSTPDNGVLN